jgi:hypothetical protein
MCGLLIWDQAVPVPQQRSQSVHRLLRPEGGMQQADRVEILQPLAIQDIGLSAGYILHVPGVDQADRKAPILQDLKQRNPEYACRFHRNSADPARLQPVGERDKIGGERFKAADRFGVPVRRHGDVDFRCPDIDSRRVWFDQRRRHPPLCAFSPCFLPSTPWAVSPGRERRAVSQTGSSARCASANVTTDKTTQPGTTLDNGLRSASQNAGLLADGTGPSYGTADRAQFLGPS